MVFFVRYIGHVDQDRRPVNFPEELYVDIFYQVNNEQELKQQINDQAVTFIKQQCMICPIDNGTHDVTKAFDRRMIVPFTLITHITTQTKQVTGELPDFINGVNILSDGTKVNPS